METETTRTQWITPDEMRRILRLGKNKTFAILASGEVDAIKVGRAVRVNRESLDRFIASHPYKPGSKKP